MDRREERSRVTSRVVRLGEDDGRFDADFWRDVPPHERLDAVWGLVLEYLALQGSDGDEPRLQRSVCRVERRGR